MSDNQSLSTKICDFLSILSPNLDLIEYIKVHLSSVNFSLLGKLFHKILEKATSQADKIGSAT
ncbi:hypothetical protein ACFLY2_02060 [Patescibacteria group bacterium]